MVSTSSKLSSASNNILSSLKDLFESNRFPFKKKPRNYVKLQHKENT